MGRLTQPKPLYYSSRKLIDHTKNATLIITQWPNSQWEDKNSYYTQQCSSIFYALFFGLLKQKGQRKEHCHRETQGFPARQLSQQWTKEEKWLFLETTWNSYLCHLIREDGTVSYVLEYVATGPPNQILYGLNYFWDFVVIVFVVIFCMNESYS